MDTWKDGLTQTVNDIGTNRESIGRAAEHFGHELGDKAAGANIPREEVTNRFAEGLKHGYDALKRGDVVTK